MSFNWDQSVFNLMLPKKKPITPNPPNKTVLQQQALNDDNKQ